MSNAAEMRKGWCPGALRPMRSGDGLLLRVRPRAGALCIAELRAIGNVAGRFGSGEIDLTNRGNLQIRGVADQALDGALAALDAAGLLDQSPESEAVRNVAVDPLCGIDPDRADIRGLAARMEDVLQSDPRLWSLPGKFGFSFSGTSDPRISATSADIMVSRANDRLAICLDGAADAFVALQQDAIVEAAGRLGLAFVELCLNDQSFRRMRDAVRRLGAATVFAMAGLPAPLRAAVPREEKALPVGLLRQGNAALGVGVGLPFGRIGAGQLGELCAAAADAGTVHTGPQRILVFPESDMERSDRLLRRVQGLGLITDAADIRLSMDVCPGAPSCPNARTNTRRDAQLLADTFVGSLRGHSIHISGCEKGCARGLPASFMFVGRGDHYDVIRNGGPSGTAEESVEADDIGGAIARSLLEPAT